MKSDEQPEADAENNHGNQEVAVGEGGPGLFEERHLYPVVSYSRLASTYRGGAVAVKTYGRELRLFS